MYKVVKISQLIGARNMIAIAYNKSKEEAQTIIRNADDKAFYDYYIVKEF